jgi:hypothetical protein
MLKYNDYNYEETKMKFEKSITIFATEEARKKWEEKETTKKTKKNSCPACEIEAFKKDNVPIIADEDLKE